MGKGGYNTHVMECVLEYSSISVIIISTVCIHTHLNFDLKNNLIISKNSNKYVNVTPK
jgi:hypothetical protein